VRSQKIELSTPPRKFWQGDRIIFSGSQGTAFGLWALDLSRDATHPVGIPWKLTPGDLQETDAAASLDGSIVFNRFIAAVHIWRLPLSGGAGSPFTDDPDRDGCPSVSLDGRWLYFTRRILGISQIMVRDMSSNRESVAFASEENKYWPIASADGARAVFEARNDAEASIWLLERGGKSRRLCSGCSRPTSWFDGKTVFYTTARGEIAMLDVETGVSRAVLSPDPGMILGGADWNPANQHLLFMADSQGGAHQVFAVRFPAGAGTPQGPWKRLTRDITYVNQPHWSADGKSFYFLSKRDMSDCVWGMNFQAGTSPGEPFPVTHFHDLRVAPDRVSNFTRGLAVSRDSVYLTVGALSGTVWLGRLTEPPLTAFVRNLQFWR
jgi:hypothetical protein